MNVLSTDDPVRGLPLHAQNGDQGKVELYFRYLEGDWGVQYLSTKSVTVGHGPVM